MCSFYPDTDCAPTYSLVSNISGHNRYLGENNINKNPLLLLALVVRK